MRTIKIKPRYSDEDIERLANLLLEGKIDDLGEDDVLDRAIKIANAKSLEVLFDDGAGRVFTSEMAYRLRFVRALDIRDRPADPQKVTPYEATLSERDERDDEDHRPHENL
jgi:hypothetical protein